MFLHKDELKDKYIELATTELPAIFLEQNNKFSLLVSKDQLNTLKSVAELKEVLKSILV